LTWGTGKVPVEWQKPDLSSAEWNTRAIPNREGLGFYIVAIMASHDPERSAREDREFRGEKGTKHAADLRKVPIEEAKRQMLAVIDKYEPVTFNEICIRLLDINASMALGGNYESALWELVETGTIEHTMEAPIYFRRVRKR